MIRGIQIEISPKTTALVNKRGMYSIRFRPFCINWTTLESPPATTRLMTSCDSSSSNASSGSLPVFCKAARCKAKPALMRSFSRKSGRSVEIACSTKKRKQSATSHGTALLIRSASTRVLTVSRSTSRWAAPAPALMSTRVIHAAAIKGDAFNTRANSQSRSRNDGRVNFTLSHMVFCSPRVKLKFSRGRKSFSIPA